MPKYGVEKYIQDVKDGTIKPKEERRKKSAVEEYAEKMKNNPKFSNVQADKVIIPQIRSSEEWKPTKRTKENQSY